MNPLLQKHGCGTIFKVPDGLKELMSDISREVLRAQPDDIIDFIAKYLTTLLITRENGLLSIILLKDVCDCREDLEDELLKIGFDSEHAKVAADVINLAFEGINNTNAEEVVEKQLLVQLLCLTEMTKDEITATFLVIRKSFKDYRRRMQALKETLPPMSVEPWQRAAERTIRLYETTRPTVEELQRASTKIQAAYKGYFVRRNNILKAHESSEISSKTLTDEAGSREPLFGLKMNFDMVSDQGNADKTQVPSSTQTPPTEESNYLQMESEKTYQHTILLEEEPRLENMSQRAVEFLDEHYSTSEATEEVGNENFDVGSEL